MYVHCHNCKWEQDDFWSEDGYNPAEFLAGLNRDLFGDLNETVTCGEYVGGKKIRPDITKREWIARFYEQYAKHIRTMKWITAEQFYADPNKACPRCGSALDSD